MVAQESCARASCMALRNTGGLCWLADGFRPGSRFKFRHRSETQSTMKNYMVFFGLNYYPRGGMDDFIGDADTIEEAREILCKAYEDSPKIDQQWGEIYSLSERAQVEFKLWAK